MRHPILRLRATFRRVRGILGALGLWFFLAFLGFRFGGESWYHSALASLYLEVMPGTFAQAYAFWGQSVIFGVLIALLVREGLENYSERSRLMAGLVKDHTIIVGYNHLGRRLVTHCLDKKIPYVLIEKNRDLVDDLLRRGECVVVDDVRSPDALPAANIKAAKRLILASDDWESGLLATKHARDQNPTCYIFARCPNDELIEVFEKIGANHVFSTSRSAYQDLSKEIT